MYKTMKTVVVANVCTLMYFLLVGYGIIQNGVSAGTLLQSMLPLLLAYVNRYYCNKTAVTYLNAFVGVPYLLTIGIALVVGASIADDKDLPTDGKAVVSGGIFIGLVLMTIPILLVYLNNKACIA